MNQTQFSDSIGIKQSSLSRIESGVGNPSEGTMRVICMTHNINSSWLYHGDGEMFIQKEPESKVNVYARVEEIIERMRLDHEAEKRELYDIIKHDREIQRSLIEQLKKVK